MRGESWSRGMREVKLMGREILGDATVSIRGEPPGSESEPRIPCGRDGTPRRGVNHRPEMEKG